ncbi:hypothetical protein L7F22_002071 [Adiantum nelumboides]|nr:hypothetical protein [Adiantum nelumboides]
MASDESDELPMLTGLARGISASIELSNLPSSHRRTRRAQDHHSFSGPVQPINNRFFSGPLQRNNIIIANSNNAGRAASASLHEGFYSGPIRIKNEASSSSAIRPPASTPVRRRESGLANEHLLRSGPLGRCDDPFCTTCPLYFDRPQPGTRPFYSSLQQQVSPGFVGKLKKPFVDAISWGLANMPGVMNPHTKRVQQWNKFFLLSCLLAVFVDPLFFFILSVNQEFRCIYFNYAFAKAITVLRSATDLVYFCHMLLQCHLAYLEPSSVGSGVLNDKPKQIIKHYLTGWFILDFIVVLPLPQIMIWVIIPDVLGKEYGANFAKNFLRIIILLQYFPRMIRFFPLLAGNSPTGFIFETAWSNFFINLLLFLLVAHVVGSCWYLFGLQGFECSRGERICRPSCAPWFIHFVSTPEMLERQQSYLNEGMERGAPRRNITMDCIYDTRGFKKSGHGLPLSSDFLVLKKRLKLSAQ